MLTATLAPGLASSRVAKGLSLVDGQTVIALKGAMSAEKGRSIRARVPAGLQPGLYAVVATSPEGRGPRVPGVWYRVLPGGKGGKLPATMTDLERAVDGALAADSRTEVSRNLVGVLDALRAAPVGPALTAQTRRAARDQALSLLAQGGSSPDRERLLPRGDLLLGWGGRAARAQFRARNPGLGPNPGPLPARDPRHRALAARPRTSCLRDRARIEDDLRRSANAGIRPDPSNYLAHREIIDAYLREGRIKPRPVPAHLEKRRNTAQRREDSRP
jgi:hypothetical protein